jgi:hypothetical protein
MNAAARLTLRGRRAAEALMVDTCRITNVTGTVDNPDGSVTKTTETIYEGKCRLQTFDPYERTPQSTEVELTIRRDVLQLPMSATGISTGHKVEYLTSALDPDLPGRTFRITGPARKTHQTMRRMYVEEDTTDGG